MDVPSSKLKVEIAKILKEEGYILNFKVTEDGQQGTLQVDLKYGADGRPAIDGIQRASQPGPARATSARTTSSPSWAAWASPS